MLEINKIYKGNCLDLFREVDNESVDCIITSPPYWQLRDYKWDGQWGLEPTFQEYLEHLWQMMDEVWRVLKPTGTVWINLGDTYSASVRTGRNGNKLSEKQSIKRTKTEIPDKCLLLIPHRFAIGCIEPDYELRDDLTDEEKLFVINELIKYGV
jgi:site-specific DNA-methyltransferase (adenine-specific)